MEKKQFECIFFTPEIETDVVDLLLTKMQEVSNSKKIPVLMLHTNGGNTTTGFYLHDQLKLQFPDLIIIGSGTVSSIGINIFLAAKKENRYITENTHFLMHEIGFFPGKEERKKHGWKKRITVSDEEFKRLPKSTKVSYLFEKKFSDTIISKETSLGIEKISKLEKKETFLKPKDIIKYGFASKIISSLDEI
jgi:ATP-dependent protease ClpP protease subunit